MEEFNGVLKGVISALVLKIKGTLESIFVFSNPFFYWNLSTY